MWHCTAADHSTLNNDPTTTYDVTSSGAGLGEFGNAASSSCSPAAVAGVLNQQCDPTANSHAELDTYVGTDDPPTATGLSDASAAAGGGVQELTIPVTQSLVAIVLSLPVGIFDRQQR